MIGRITELNQFMWTIMVTEGSPILSEPMYLFLTGHQFAMNVDRTVGRKVRIEYRKGPNYGLHFAIENVE